MPVNGLPATGSKCMHQFRTSLLLAIIVVFAGCSRPSKVVVSPTATPTPVHILSQLTVAQAWGNGHITHFDAPLGMPPGHHIFSTGGSAGQYSVTDDDQVCGRIMSPNDPNDPQQAHVKQSLVLFNLHTGALTILQELPEGYFMTACAATGPWIIWSQSVADDITEHWQIKAFNRQTQEVRLLDEPSQGHPSHAPTPSSGHGLAGWTSVIDDQGHTAAALYDFATGIKTLEAPGTSFPLISWPWISWGIGAQEVIVFQNMVTHQQVLLHPPSLATTAFSGTTFVASNAEYTAITLYPEIGQDMLARSYVVGKGIAGDFVEFPSVNDRLVTWISNNTLFAFDRKLLRPVLIYEGLSGSPGPFISGHYMIWGGSDPHQESSLDVIDTNTLP